MSEPAVAELETPLEQPSETEAPAVEQEAPAPEAPAPETPVLPEPSRERSVQEIDADIRSKGDDAVTGAEFRRWAQAVEDQQRRDAAENERREAQRQIFPTKTKALVERVAERFNLTDADSRDILTKLVEDEMLHGDDSLAAQARAAFVGPQVEHQAGQLYAYAGRTQQALNWVNGLEPTQHIPAAFALGQLNPANKATKEQVKEWAEGKDIPKTALVTAEEAAQRVEWALKVEREARGESGAPGPYRGGAGGARDYSWYMSLTPEQRRDLPPAEEQAIIRSESRRRMGR